ncbi:hypothetical protein EVAR_40144_1 [Eumeta japonica]|uniref:Uncharacterized protein n=1 Tax=Eumeta variegata TaxID=151549 RepID=A0A4C1W8A0_EUMVA|nr:hypothetical protein EVAR_40144_1 [Eumeta japonica]
MFKRGSRSQPVRNRNRERDRNQDQEQIISRARSTRSKLILGPGSEPESGIEIAIVADSVDGQLKRRKNSFYIHAGGVASEIQLIKLFGRQRPIIPRNFVRSTGTYGFHDVKPSLMGTSRLIPTRFGNWKLPSQHAQRKRSIDTKGIREQRRMIRLFNFISSRARRELADDGLDPPLLLMHIPLPHFSIEGSHFNFGSVRTYHFGSPLVNPAATEAPTGKAYPEPTNRQLPRPRGRRLRAQSHLWPRAAAPRAPGPGPIYALLSVVFA